MPKKPNQPITCPCCRKKVRKEGLSKISQLMPFDGFMSFGGAKDLLSSFIQVSQVISYQWACNSCLGSGKALLADPRRQFYTFTYPWDTAIPYLAYFDKQYTCQKCEEPFTFSKEEQQYWYEKLQFVVFSEPRHCQSCRKQLRADKHLNQELSDLLRDGQPEDQATLLRIVELYEQMGKEEKMKQYRRMAQKALK